MRNIVRAITVLACLRIWRYLLGAGECHDGDVRYRAALMSDDRVVALEALTRACPSHVKALNDLALAYEEDERFSAAANYYRKAIQAEPDFPLPYAGLGDVLLAEGHCALQSTHTKVFYVCWRNRIQVICTLCRDLPKREGVDGAFIHWWNSNSVSY